MSKITLQDVADNTGMSLSLVSSVLRGGGLNVAFSDVTRPRVFRAARNFKHNRRIANGISVVHSIGKRDAQNHDWVQRIRPVLGSIHGKA